MGIDEILALRDAPNANESNILDMLLHSLPPNDVSEIKACAVHAFFGRRNTKLYLLFPGCSPRDIDIAIYDLLMHLPYPDWIDHLKGCVVRAVLETPQTFISRSEAPAQRPAGDDDGGGAA